MRSFKRQAREQAAQQPRKPGYAINIVLVGAAPIEWDVTRRPELHPFIPRSMDTAQLNYGQGEGQFRVRDAVWGVYVGERGRSNEMRLQFEEGTLTPDELALQLNGIREAAEQHFGFPFEIRVEGVHATQVEEYDDPTRVIWFLLALPLTQVERRLAEAGYEKVPMPDRSWWTDSGWNASLSCVSISHLDDAHALEWCSDPRELIRGLEPSVEVRVPLTCDPAGDARLLRLARTLLAESDGYAFDDYTREQHAWNLREIEGGHLVDGLRFSDYAGFREQQAARRRENR